MHWSVGPALGALAFGLVMLGTRPPGPGLYGDSAGYMGAAESLARHGTLRVPFAPYTSADSTSPLAQWPPGFPVLIAGPMLGGASAVTGARLVVAASAAVTVILAVLIVGNAAGLAWGVMAALVLMLTTSVVSVHLDALSEPPFIAATMATLAACVWWPRRPLAYGATAGVATLLRYMGVGVVIAAAAWGFAQPARTTRERIGRGVLAALPGLLVYLAWSIHVRHSGAIVEHPHLDHFPLVTIRRFVGALLAWLAPESGDGLRAGRAVFKALLLLGCIWLVVRQWASPVVRAAIVIAAGSAGLLLASQLLQENVELSERMFSPVHAMLDIAIVTALALAWRPAMGLALAAWAAGTIPATVGVIRGARTEGRYHAQRTIVESPLWRWVRDSTSARPAALYSNDFADIYFVTHRPSRWMPWVVTADSARRFLASCHQPALIVWASGYTETVIYPDLLSVVATPARLEAALPLRRVATFPTGMVWEVQGCAQ
jgi:hypothetical protein